MSKKSKKTKKSNIKNVVQLKQTKVNIDEELVKLEEQKAELAIEIENLEALKKDLTNREERLKENMIRVEAIESDVQTYLSNLKMKGEEKIKSDLKVLYGEESIKIQEEQQKIREKLAEDWKNHGKQVDLRIMERLEETDKFISKRQELCQEQIIKLEKEKDEFRQSLSLFSEEKQKLELELFSKSEELEVKKAEFVFEKERICKEQQVLQTKLVETEENKIYQLGIERERLSALQEECTKLREQNYQLQAEIRQCSAHIGQDVQGYQQNMKELEESNQLLRVEMSDMVPKSVQIQLLKLRGEYKEMEEKLGHWEVSEQQSRSYQLKLQETEQNLQLILSQLNFKNCLVEDKQEQIKNLEYELSELKQRYCTPTEYSEDYQMRLKQLTSGYQIPYLEEKIEHSTSEMEWLAGIWQKCKEVQMIFPKRIFYAFHTAMKISDWSIITVLAGVSGTGKSKLPELYASFGGLNFISVPVQPNWDSQESMLGFYNSLDNRFEAEELLKFLICSMEVSSQVQKEIQDKLQKNKYKDPDKAYIDLQNEEKTLSLVLLDEMNLAHVEQYFPEFLSKLESRRGQANIPSVNIKLGTGVKPYPLELGRNILWAGTMNQDETTKSLSDKVLDRVIVINFPRPNVFLRRESQKNQNKFASETRLTYKVWHTWLTRDTRYELFVSEEGCVLKEEEVQKIKTGDSQKFQRKIDHSQVYLLKNHEVEKEMAKYKLLVEEINRIMSLDGRSLGHRVWQSMEYYVVNYPLVILEMERSYDHSHGSCRLTQALKSAINMAMEDQVAQKIMPKLRGLDLTVDGTLYKIRKILSEDTKDNEKFYFSKAFLRDYDRACEQGYGQFMWVTSEFVEDENESEFARDLANILDKTKKKNLNEESSEQE